MAEELLEQLAPRFEAKCRCRIDELVATGLSGIGSAEGCLCRLFDDTAAAEQYAERPLLNRMLVEASTRKKSLRRVLDRDLASCRRRLQQILGAQPDRPLSAPPFWLFHPLSFLRTRRLQKERVATLRDWQETVDGLRTQAEKLQAVKCIHRVLELLAMIVMRERGDLCDLTKKLHQMASAIGTADRARVPKPRSVDRPIVSSDCFERIYASAIDDAGLTDLNEALRRLVVDNRLLDGFRSASVAQLAARIEQEGRHFFDGVQQIGIDVLLGEGPYTRFVRSEGDAMAGLWELAEPLVDTGAAAMPEAWQPGELLAVWLPDPDHLVHYSPAQAAAQRNFHLNRGTPTSIHLCRVVHGFTMSSLARLKVYTPSYDALENKSDLHIVDWESDLPPLL